MMKYLLMCFLSVFSALSFAAQIVSDSPDWIVQRDNALPASASIAAPDIIPRMFSVSGDDHAKMVEPTSLITKADAPLHFERGWQS